jgi:protocatechuate 3,4-dioxygenase alpha subunit
MATQPTGRRLSQTPSQTLGPFFHYALPWRGGADLAGTPDLGARPELIAAGHNHLVDSSRRGPVAGEPIEVRGRVLDGDGAAVADALIEIWQANTVGRYASPADPRTDLPLDPSFVGFGRAATLEDGSFAFRTVRPGPTPGPGNTLQAPHLAVGVLGRGLLKRLVTRLYFSDGAGLSDDPILALVPQPRRRTLIALRAPGSNLYRFDIILQGPDETVFFDI